MVVALGLNEKQVPHTARGQREQVRDDKFCWVRREEKTQTESRRLGTRAKDNSKHRSQFNGKMQGEEAGEAWRGHSSAMPLRVRS